MFIQKKKKKKKLLTKNGKEVVNVKSTTKSVMNFSLFLPEINQPTSITQTTRFMNKASSAINT